MSREEYETGWYSPDDILEEEEYDAEDAWIDDAQERHYEEKYGY